MEQIAGNYAVRIYVTDRQRALDFFSKTLGMPVIFAGTEMGWAEFDTGEARLVIERVSPDDAEGNQLAGRFVSVSLQVDDIRATYETLRSRGVEFLEPPETQPWGGVLAHFRDPDGNVLTLFGS